jgi:hypothetical protein
MSRTLVLVLFLTFSLASANFDFFGNMFGNQQQHHQQQQHRSGAAQWAAQVDSGIYTVFPDIIYALNRIFSSL